MQYDPAKVITTIGGFVMKKFGADTMIEVEFEEDRNTMFEGVQGEGRHIKNNSKKGTVTLTLSGASNSNEVINALDKADQPFPISVIDKNSNGDLFISTSCKVKTTPTLTAGKDMAEKVWVFNFLYGKLNPAGAKEAS
jgi:hypothetical protein